jgi:hypothetical protein
MESYKIELEVIGTVLLKISNNMKKPLDRSDEKSKLIQLDENESIVLESQKNNALMSKENFSSKIDLSLQQYEDGKFKTLEPSMDVQEFLNSMCAE